MTWFVKYYKCSVCGHEWEDEHETVCNDRCPECNTETEPYAYDDVTDTEADREDCN